MFVNYDTFMVEILGMTNYCNLRCEYCDWEKRRKIGLTKQYIENAKLHLSEARFFIKRHYPSAKVIEYSGGEPFVYPQIVHELLNTFPDYWVRVITNALLVKEEDIKKFAQHGKAFLSISLDGYSIGANKERGINVYQLSKIIDTIDLALNSNVPVMILCTLSEDNIAEFPEFIEFVSNKWSKFIDNGMLVLPAHLLSSYAIEHRAANRYQIRKFRKDIQLLEEKYPIVGNIKEHYDSLYASKRQCSVYQWSASMHFLGDSIIKEGDFTSFRCGMRGVGKIGVFNISEEIIKDTFSEVMSKALEVPFNQFQCGCTVDWNAIDLIISRVIPIERATKWFVLFKDSEILNWIGDHKENFKSAYTMQKGRKSYICPRIVE